MIRADPAIGMAPIMFLSARGDTADKVRAFRSGAEDYMVKPFDAAELLARVAKALDRQARELGASPTTQLPGAGRSRPRSSAASAWATRRSPATSTSIT